MKKPPLLWILLWLLCLQPLTAHAQTPTVNLKILRVYSGYTGMVLDAKFSPDGKTILIAVGNYAHLKDTATGNHIKTLSGHTEGVNSVAFSPDGKQIVTGSWDDTARVWEVSSGKTVQTLSGHTEGVNSVTFSPDGKQVVTGSGDKTARVWEVSSGKTVQTFSGHTEGVTLVAFSPDGKQVVTGSNDDKARVWEVSSGKTLLTLPVHIWNVAPVAFSPDGKQIVTGSWDKTARVWEVSSGKTVQTLSGHTGTVSSIAFSPDGKQIVTGSWDDTARVWEVSSGKLLLTLSGHTGSVDSVAFSPDGKQVVTGSSDKTARVWEVSSGKTLLTLSGHMDSVAFSPNGKQVVTGSNDDKARVWEVSSGKLLLTLSGHTEGVNSVAFSPDGKQVVTGSWDNTARVWEVSSRKTLLTLSGHTGSVDSVAFSPDGKQVVTGSSDKTARVWEVSSGKTVLTLSGHTGSVDSVAFSPDGKQVVTGSSDKTARVWEVSSGKTVLTLSGHTGSVDSVAFSPDGKQVVTGSSDKTARVWEVSSGKELRQFKVFSSKFAVSSGSSLLIYDEEDCNSLRLVNYLTGETLRKFRQDGCLGEFVVSPDGKSVLSSRGVIEDGSTFSLWGFDDPSMAFWNPPQQNVTAVVDGGGVSVRVVQPLEGSLWKPGEALRSVELQVLGVPVGGVPLEVSAGGVVLHSGRVGRDGVVSVPDLKFPVGLPAGPVDVEFRVGSVVQSVQLQVVASPVVPAVVTRKSNVFFLGVAVTQFKSVPLNLKFTVNDVTAMKSFLIRQEGRLWGKVWEKTLVEQNASLANVKAALSELQAQDIQPDDLVIVYISSHGLSAQLPSGKMQYFAVLYDSVVPSGLTQTYQVQELRNVLSEKDLTQALNPLRSKVMVLLDTCFSGVSRDAKGVAKATGVVGTVSLSKADSFKEFVGNDQEQRVVWSSTDSSSVSYEDDRFARGVFSHFLMRRLQVGAESGLPYTVGSLQESVYREVVTFTSSPLGFNQGPQKPEVFGNRDLEFLPELR